MKFSSLQRRPVPATEGESIKEAPSDKNIFNAKRPSSNQPSVQKQLNESNTLYETVAQRNLSQTNIKSSLSQKGFKNIALKISSQSKKQTQPIIIEVSRKSAISPRKKKNSIGISNQPQVMMISKSQIQRPQTNSQQLSHKEQHQVNNIGFKQRVDLSPSQHKYFGQQQSSLSTLAFSVSHQQHSHITDLKLTHSNINKQKRQLSDEVEQYTRIQAIEVFSQNKVSECALPSHKALFSKYHQPHTITIPLSNQGDQPVKAVHNENQIMDIEKQTLPVTLGERQAYEDEISSLKQQLLVQQQHFSQILTQVVSKVASDTESKLMLMIDQMDKRMQQLEKQSQKPQKQPDDQCQVLSAVITESDIVEELESDRLIFNSKPHPNNQVNRYFTLNQIEELKSQEEQSMKDPGCDLGGYQMQGASMQDIAGILLESRDGVDREQHHDSFHQPKFLSHLINSQNDITGKSENIMDSAREVQMTYQLRITPSKEGKKYINPHERINRMMPHEHHQRHLDSMSSVDVEVPNEETSMTGSPFNQNNHSLIQMKTPASVAAPTPSFMSGHQDMYMRRLNQNSIGYLIKQNVNSQEPPPVDDTIIQTLSSHLCGNISNEGGIPGSMVLHNEEGAAQPCQSLNRNVLCSSLQQQSGEQLSNAEERDDIVSTLNHVALNNKAIIKNMQVHQLSNSVQKEGRALVIDIKTILEQRGSKCTCKIIGGRSVSQGHNPYSKNAIGVAQFAPDHSGFEKEVKTCGNYCKYLQPSAQRDIIQAKLKEEFGCLISKANQGRPGDKKYLISSIWWRQWCDYVNFDLQNALNGEDNLAFKINNNMLLLEPSQIPANQYKSVPNKKTATPYQDRFLMEESGKFRKAHFEQPLIQFNHLQSEEQDLMMPSESARQRLDNFRQELHTIKMSQQQEIGEHLMHKGQTKHQYDRPGMVQNQQVVIAFIVCRILLKDGRSMNLKDNLVEHFDFEAITPAIWKYLYSWYSADWCIMRLLKRDRMNPNAAILDLYPENSIPGQIILDQTEDESSSQNYYSLKQSRTFEYQSNDNHYNGDNNNNQKWSQQISRRLFQ